MSLPCNAYHVISYVCRPYNLFCYECRCVQKVVKIVCLTHDMLQSVIVSGVVIYHISNVNDVLQYTHITALYNTSVCNFPGCTKYLFTGPKYACPQF